MREVGAGGPGHDHAHARELAGAPHGRARRRPLRDACRGCSPARAAPGGCGRAPSPSRSRRANACVAAGRRLPPAGEPALPRRDPRRRADRPGNRRTGARPTSGRATTARWSRAWRASTRRATRSPSPRRAGTSVLGFGAEQWVEVNDESRMRRGLPGILLRDRSRSTASRARRPELPGQAAEAGRGRWRTSP